MFSKSINKLRCLVIKDSGTSLIACGRRRPFTPIPILLRRLSVVQMDKRAFCQCDLCIDHWEPNPAYPGENRRGRTILRRTYATHQTGQAIRDAQRKVEALKREQEQLQKTVVQAVIGHPDEADAGPRSLPTRPSDIYVEPSHRSRQRKSSSPVMNSGVYSTYSTTNRWVICSADLLTS